MFLLELTIYKTSSNKQLFEITPLHTLLDIFRKLPLKNLNFKAKVDNSLLDFLKTSLVKKELKTRFKNYCPDLFEILKYYKMILFGFVI